MTGVSKGAAVLSIAPETLDPGLSSGSFVVQIGTISGTENVGSYDLDLDFTNFFGDLSGQQVTVTAFTPLFGSFFPVAPVPGPVSQNGSFVVQGVTSPSDNQITTTARDFFRG